MRFPPLSPSPLPLPRRTTACHWITLLGALLLSACAGKPPAPDWQTNAFAALKGFSSAYLSGNTRLADFEFARAKSELASTGRADLLARAELTRCAVRLASLEFDQCAGYQPLAAEAGPEEQAYAAFLSAQWRGLDAARLPPQYRVIVLNAVTDTPPDSRASAIETIEDPLARLVAAAALLQSARLNNTGIVMATETASGQGWRRPLLAWLGLQRQRALQANDPVLAARLERRVDLVLQGAAKTP